MFKIEYLIEMIGDLIRAWLLDAFSEGLSELRRRFRRGPRGMAGVRRHVHRQCSRRLRRRLST
jgi:hypothetical protein